MTTPTVTPVSGSEFNIAWEEPALVNRRGLIISYTVFNYQAKDPTDEFAPPYSWKVIYDLSLATHACSGTSLKNK